VVLVPLLVMTRLPAVATEVLEARQVPAEVRALLEEAAGAERILQIRIHLHFLVKLLAFDLYEGCSHSLHVGLVAVKSDPATAYGVLVLVRINASIDYSTKQIIKDTSKALGVQHSVQSSYKHSLLGVQPLVRTEDIVTVPQHPGDDLHLLAPHPSARDFKIPGTTISIVVSALGQ